MSSIAVKFGTTVEALMALNEDEYPAIRYPHRLAAGWCIQVPNGSGVAPVTGLQPDAGATSCTSDTAAAQTPAAAPALDADGGYFQYDAALEIVRLTNEERVKAGLAPLAIDERVMEIARLRAMEVASEFSHASRAGLFDGCVSQCWENAGRGPLTAQSAVNGWMNSASHSANILRSGIARTGAGFYILNGESYAVQVFEQ